MRWQILPFDLLVLQHERQKASETGRVGLIKGLGFFCVEPERGLETCSVEDTLTDLQICVNLTTQTHTKAHTQVGDNIALM